MIILEHMTRRWRAEVMAINETAVYAWVISNPMGHRWGVGMVVAVPWEDSADLKVHAIQRRDEHGWPVGGRRAT